LLLDWNRTCKPALVPEEIIRAVDNEIKCGTAPIGHLRDSAVAQRGPAEVLALLDHAPRFRPPTPEELLSESGISSWQSQPDSQTELRAFEYVSNHATNLDAISRASLRERLCFTLKKVGYRGPSRIVDTLLKARDTPGNPSVLNATLQHLPASVLSANELEVLHGCCRGLSEERNILDRVADVMHQFSIAGEDRLIKLSYLVITARLLDRPANLIIKGPSSVGKSYPLEVVLRLFPGSAYYALTSMSEHGLVYLTEPMAHRMLIVYEATGFESNEHSYLLRSLLSEGKLAYQTNEKVDGKIQPRLVVLEGPTGLITTTTAVNLHPENETRALSIVANDSPEQTRAVMQAQAREPADLPDIAPFVALQEWLTHAEHRVTVPFAAKLAEHIDPVAVRLRRDFPTVLTLIRAHAVLHQVTRKKDSTGQIIADLDDYEAVRQLVSEAIGSQVDATVPDTVRQTVEAVAQMYEATQSPVSISDLRRELKLDKSTISRRVKVALKHDYLQNEERYKGRPYKLEPGDPLPASTEILPAVEVLQLGADRCGDACNTYLLDPKGDTGKRCSVAVETEGIAAPSAHSTAIADSTADTNLRERAWQEHDRIYFEAQKRKLQPKARAVVQAVDGLEFFEGKPPCYACGSTKRYRKHSGGAKVCFGCHPPAG
jgi:hypothetical protein